MSGPPVASSEPLIVGIAFGADHMIAEMGDGSIVRASIARFPRLLAATAEERDHWRLIGRGEGVHWPVIDEDLPVASILSAGLS